MSERLPPWEGLNDCDCFEDEASMQNTDKLLAIRPTTKGQKTNGCLSMTSARNYILPKLGIVEHSPAAGGNSQPRSCNLIFGDPEQTAQLCCPRPLTSEIWDFLKWILSANLCLFMSQKWKSKTTESIPSTHEVSTLTDLRQFTGDQTLEFKPPGMQRVSYQNYGCCKSCFKLHYF